MPRSFLAPWLVLITLVAADYAPNLQDPIAAGNVTPQTIIERKTAACVGKSWGDVCSFLAEKQTISARCAPVKGQLVCGPKRRIGRAAGSSTAH